MKAKAFKIVNLILAVLVFVFALGQAFAWFAEDMRKSQDKFDGSSASPYFESGDGSEGSPFVLSSYNHLYNLAWLQNTGNLNERYYYFQLKNDITVPNNFWLPPIGTDEYPFQGYFDGKGNKIINLKTTTDSSKLTGAVSGSSVKYSNAVGMFGMTAAHVGVLVPKIFDLNLINPVVEVASQNTTYDATSAEKTNVGIAIGFANCGAENIGVYKGKLSVQKTGYTTVNSIIGGYDSKNVDGSGISGSGTDIGFGGSLSFLDMMRRMYLISLKNENTGRTPWTTPKMEFNGFNSAKSSNILKYQYMPLTVSNAVDLENDTFYKNHTAEEIPITNIGFYVGAESKIKPRASTNFLNNGKLKPVYTMTPVGDDGATAEKTELTNLANNVETALNEFMKQDNTYGVRFNQQMNTNYWIKIAGVNIAGYSKIDITVPRNTIWFAAQNTGFAKIVFSSDSGTLQRGVSIYHIIRTGISAENPFYTALTNENSSDVSEGGYGQAASYGGVSNVIIRAIETAYENTLANGEKTYTYGSADAQATTSKKIYDYYWYDENKIFADSNGLYYTEIPIIKDNEYAFGLRDDNGAWIIYMDIGQNAGGEEGGSGTALPTIENIDFIYDDGSSNVVLIGTSGFVATNVIFKFTVNDVTYLYFYRPANGKDGDSNTLYVDYNVEGSGTEPTFKMTGSCKKTKQAGLTSGTFLTYPSAS